MGLSSESSLLLIHCCFLETLFEETAIDLKLLFIYLFFCPWKISICDIYCLLKMKGIFAVRMKMSFN